MKTIYPLVALLSAALVSAGPIPRSDNIDIRSDDLVHTANQPRTEPVAAPPPAAMPEPAPSADAAKIAADAMEAEHVAKAQAADKAHQEGMKSHFDILDIG
jgi:hypothetical protein